MLPGGLAVLAALAGATLGLGGSASARVMPDTETAFRSTAVLEQVVRPELISRVTPAIPAEGSTGKLEQRRGRKSSRSNGRQRRGCRRAPLPSAGWPLNCILIPRYASPKDWDLRTKQSISSRPVRARSSQRQGGTGSLYCQTAFEIEPPEVRESVTVTVPSDSPVARKQAEGLLKALRLPCRRPAGQV